MRVTCQCCSQEFIVLKKELNRGNGKFCSRKCTAIAGNKERRKKFYARLKNLSCSLLEIEPEIGHYIAGLVDGEGSFLATLSESPVCRLKAVFKVELSIDDKALLEWLRIIFKSGNTYCLKRRNPRTKEAFRFVIQDLESLITKVIPFFDQYPLQGKKAQDFIKFKSIISKYINYKLNDNASIFSLKQEIEKLNKVYQPSAEGYHSLLNGCYISGLTDGEGTFAVKVSKDNQMRIGYRVKPTFSIQLSEKDADLLVRLRDTLNCGTVRFVYNRPIADFSVQSIKDLHQIIVPFFDRFSLRAKKKNDFELFKAVVEHCVRKEHLTLTGLDKILKLRDRMNSGGASNRLKIYVN